MATKSTLAKEIDALSAVLEALSDLEPTAQQWVLATAAGKLGATLPASPPYSGTQAPPGTPKPAFAPVDTPKSFLRAKAPNSDVQRVACLAWYLTHQRDEPHFKSIGISKLNTESAGAKLNVARAVANATSLNKYLAPAGKGKKQITALGEDVVDALPDQAAVSSLAKRSRKRTRKGRARKLALKQHK